MLALSIFTEAQTDEPWNLRNVARHRQPKACPCRAFEALFIHTINPAYNDILNYISDAGAWRQS